MRLESVQECQTTFRHASPVDVGRLSVTLGKRKQVGVEGVPLECGNFIQCSNVVIVFLANKH